MHFSSSLEPAAPWVAKGRRGMPCGRCDTEGRHWDVRGWRCELHTPWASWEHPPEIRDELDPAGRDPCRRWPWVLSKEAQIERSTHVPKYPRQHLRNKRGRNRWDS